MSNIPNETKKNSIYSEMDDSFLSLSSLKDDVLALNSAMFSILDAMLDHADVNYRKEIDTIFSIVKIQERILKSMHTDMDQIWDKSLALAQTHDNLNA